MLRNIANFLVAVGPWGLLLLAFLDSAGIPLPNGLDAYLIFLAVKDPAGAYRYAAISVAGSVIGNVALFLAARRGGRRFMERTEPGRGERFRRWFERFGLVTIFVPALMPVPMPLKFFVISAGALRTRFVAFLVVILAARIPRYFGEAWLGIKLGQGSTAFLKQHLWHFIIAAIALFILLS
ncbi:MAG TPA: VTT domain-containing protein, partial [Bryobacteraceae bacterium]|nr:VTT domain-containing protein [Bryobacteraceae bacterium]